MSILTQDPRELKASVRLYVVYAPDAASHSGGDFSSLKPAKDAQNLTPANFDSNSNNPVYYYDGKPYNKLSKGIKKINSNQSAYSLGVNTNKSASSCTFASGGILPQTVHPIFNLLKGPDYPLVTAKSGKKTQTIPKTPDTNTDSKLPLPVIPFKKTANDNFPGTVPILYSYNIWDIKNPSYTEYIPYIGPVFKGNIPSIETLIDPSNGASLNVKSLNGKCTIIRLFRVHQDAVYDDRPANTSLPKIYYPYKGNYLSEDIQAKAKNNCGFHINLNISELPKPNSEIVINYFAEEWQTVTDFICNYKIYLKYKEKPKVQFYDPVSKTFRDVNNIVAPVLDDSNKSSYDVFVHFTGSVVMFGFEPELDKWNSVYPEEQQTTLEHLVVNGIVSIDVNECNFIMRYSALIFNNYNPDTYDGTNLNTAKNSFLVDFTVDQSKASKLSATNIRSTLAKHRFMNEVTTPSNSFDYNTSFYGDWRYPATPTSQELQYDEVARRTRDSRVDVLGRVTFKTTIEAPAFLQVVNDHKDTVEQPSTALGFYPVINGDLTPWLKTWSVNCSNQLSNFSYIKKEASITLTDLDTSVEGHRILDLIESNLLIVEIKSGYLESSMSTYFQGFITRITTTRSGSNSTIELSCEDVGTYTLSNIYFEKPMLIAGMKQGDAIKSLIACSGFERNFTYDPANVGGIDLRLNANGTNNQETVKIFPTDKILDKINPILERLNSLTAQATLRWNEQTSRLHLESRYKDSTTDTLNFLGTNFINNEQVFKINYSNNVDNTPDIHGLLKDNYKIETTNTQLAAGVRTYGKTYAGFIANEDFFNDALSVASRNAVTSSLGTNGSFNYNSPIHRGYVGFRKFVIDNFQAFILPDRTAVNFKHEINKLVVRNPLHSIAFTCYVTKPLNFHGTFVVSAFIVDTVSTTDKYIYKTLQYRYDKENNVITADVRGFNQPFTIKELEQ